MKSISGNFSLKWAHVTFLLGTQLTLIVVLELLNPKAPDTWYQLQFTLFL